MSGRRLVVVAAGAAILAAGGLVLSSQRSQPFPHAAHAGLFPTCAGCHAGIVSGDSSRFFSVTAEDCAACHDGTQEKRVEWSPPERPATNLVFSHTQHVARLERAGREPLDCVGCHQEKGATRRMQVARARPETCLACHAPNAESHYASSVACATCHAPLAAARAIPVSDVADFPRPPDHARQDFVLTHERDVAAAPERCAVCHARQSCERCHLNAQEVPAIAALAPDARVAQVVAGKAGEWPRPPSHARADWATAHGFQAEASIETCANCHARPSCAACHTGAEPDVVARLPEPKPGGPRGILLADVRPPGHTAAFVFEHGAAAASGSPACMACHTEKQCADCHDAASRPRFHPVDFVVRHATEAWGDESECAACHSREAFCRDCHQASGFAAGGRTNGSFHDAEPNWLLAHGRAARQDLAACTTCHAQSTCLRCHSAKSGFRIDPHGSAFDPDRIADRSTQSCAICHFSIPDRP